MCCRIENYPFSLYGSFQSTTETIAAKVINDGCCNQPYIADSEDLLSMTNSRIIQERFDGKNEHTEIHHHNVELHRHIVLLSKCYFIGIHGTTILQSKHAEGAHAETPDRVKPAVQLLHKNKPLLY